MHCLPENKATRRATLPTNVTAVQTMVMQPVQRQGEVQTYVAGISGFDENRLDELNQTRCTC